MKITTTLLTAAALLLPMTVQADHHGEHKKAVKVDKANVVKIYIAGSNGVIHVIDTVIIPAAE